MSLCAMEALLFQAALNFFVGAIAGTGGEWSLKAPHHRNERPMLILTVCCCKGHCALFVE